jgi:aminopeptidase N
MKHQLFLSFLLFLISFIVNSQHVKHNPHAENLIHSSDLKYGAQRSLSNDTTFDVNFYHLDLEISIDHAYIQGNVGYLFTSKVNGLNSIILDLDNNFIIDSISSPSTTYTFFNNELTVNFSSTFNQGDTFSFAVYYHGAPQLAGGYKGLRYETHDGNVPVIASLSTPYLAHTWWPCKDGIHDKADSTFIDITIKDTIISSLPLIAVSNGLLASIETNGTKKTFKWKHYYPIVPFYVMVAISNYEHFQQTYTGTSYSFPIDYYVFNSHLTAAQNGVAQIPNVMDFFTNTFGDYPFRNEKYGMTQLGYYGGIENQTNSIVNNMGSSWFNVSVHELAHQWFAGMITCDTWSHGWLNEGFASYSEALYDEHVNGFSSYQSYVSDFEFYNAGTLYLNDVSDPFNGVFQSIIYNKGAYLLHMLRGVLGDTTFFNVINNYGTNNNFQYKHATTEDFQSIAENISGQNLNYFFSQWVYDERYPIYHYNYLYDQITGDLDLTIYQTQSNNGWRNVFVMPMEIKIEFADLTDTIVTVFNNSQFQTFSFVMPKVISNIELDPNSWILKKSIFDQSINVGMPEITKDVFTIYPNPVSHSIHIKSESEKDEIKVTVFDINGKSKLKKSFKPSKSGLYFLDAENLATGMYVVIISTKNTRYIKKISVIK